MFEIFKLDFHLFKVNAVIVILKSNIIIYLYCKEAISVHTSNRYTGSRLFIVYNKKRARFSYLALYFLSKNLSYESPSSLLQRATS